MLPAKRIRLTHRHLPTSPKFAFYVRNAAYRSKEGLAYPTFFVGRRTWNNGRGPGWRNHVTITPMNLTSEKVDAGPDRGSLTVDRP
jgi:hypothetical protein